MFGCIWKRYVQQDKNACLMFCVRIYQIILYPLAENLDELEKMVVVPLFEGIKNKNLVPLKFEFKDHPWGADQLKKQLYVAPVNDYNSMQLVFAVPDIYYEQYQISVIHSISYFLTGKNLL